MSQRRTATVTATVTDAGPGSRRSALLVRVRLPDRPGALGAVASRIGAVGGDVHEIEVVDRGTTRAVDELVVTVPETCPLDLMAREIDEIDGVDVEDLVEVPTIPADPRMQAFAAALDLAGATDEHELARALVDHAHRELRADHAAVIAGAGDARILGRAGGGPTDERLLALHDGGDREAPGVGADGLCLTPVGAPRGGAAWMLLTVRASPALRDRERRVLRALADIAGRLLGRLPAP